MGDMGIPVRGKDDSVLRHAFCTETCVLHFVLRHVSRTEACGVGTSVPGKDEDDVARALWSQQAAQDSL
eukprot:3195250-Rhodomonas_salina.1